MYTEPTIETRFPGRSVSNVIIQRYGQDDYGVWFTDDPSDEMSGCSSRGDLLSLIQEVRDEVCPSKPTNRARLEILDAFMEVFEEFLAEKGIDIPNDEKDDDPCASNIYGSDYGTLSDRIETLLRKLNMM